MRKNIGRGQHVGQWAGAVGELVDIEEDRARDVLRDVARTRINRRRDTDRRERGIKDHDAWIARRSASQEVVTRGFIGTSLLRRDSQLVGATEVGLPKLWRILSGLPVIRQQLVAGTADRFRDADMHGVCSGFEKSAIAVKRQIGIMNGRRGAGKLVRTACYKIQMCRKIVSE